MTSAIDTVVGIVVCLATVVGLYLTIRSGARKRAIDDAATQAEVEAKAINEGKNSRDDEVRLLKSELATSRRDEERANTRADLYEGRYNDLLRDRGQK